MTVHQPSVGTKQMSTSTSITLPAVRATAVLAALSILWQGYSASSVIVDGGSALRLHEVGAVVAHVVTGLLAAAAATHWWTTRGPLWPAVVSAVVFVATFVEAALGHDPTLWVHVPFAMLITIGTSTVLAWAFLSTARRPRRHAR